MLTRNQQFRRSFQVRFRLRCADIKPSLREGNQALIPLRLQAAEVVLVSYLEAG